MRIFYTVSLLIIFAILFVSIFSRDVEQGSPSTSESDEPISGQGSMSETIETVRPVIGATEPSNIKSDERVVLFNTAARLSSDGSEWILPIHGWVFEPQDSTFRKAALAKTLKKSFGLVATDETSANFSRRVNLFLSDNERGKRLLVTVGEHRYALPASMPNGHVNAEIRIPVAAAEPLAQNGAVPFAAVLPVGDARIFSGKVLLTGARGLSVISDIDDTVKVTEVTDRVKLLDRTFFRDFEAVNGMSALYTRWAKHGVSFHYVSSSPWQLYEPLAEFLDQAGFPPAALNLKSIRFKDETILNLFKKGTETKPLQIEPILTAYPDRHFVLIGDSGEQDPEVYAELMRKHPQQILRIYIRNADGSSATNERFQKVFRGLDAEKWKLFDDPSQLDLPTPD